MSNLDKLKEEFYRIKKLGYVPCTRSNNKDGGIGNTFEDLLGVKENNKREADFLEFEIKSKKAFTASYISLFSRRPSYPVRANTYLREHYGEVRDKNHPNKKKLYASVFGHKSSIVYEKYKMKLEVDYKNEKVFLVINDLKDKPLDKVFWAFDALKKASKKLNNLCLVTADTKTEKMKRAYHFNKAEVYNQFNFNKFLKSISSGVIMFDIRIGVHNSGKNIGKTHDHGSGFRIKKNNFKELYKSCVEL